MTSFMCLEEEKVYLKFYSQKKKYPSKVKEKERDPREVSRKRASKGLPW